MSCFFKQKLLLLAMIFLFVAAQASGQHSEIHFTALTSKDGLTSNTVNAILKDRFGLMWFATEDGLNKFNGSNFSSYRHGKSDRNDFASNQFLCLYEDDHNRLWTGTSGGSLHLYNRKKDSFTRVHASNSQANYSLNNIKSISSDADGAIWIGTLSGLIVIDPVTYQIKNFNAGKQIPAIIKNGPLLCVYRDSHRQMWVGTRSGLFRYDQASKRFISFFHNEGDQSSLAGNFVRTISEDLQCHLWIGTSNGLSMLMPDGQHFSNFRYSQAASSLSSNMVYAIKPFDKEKIWVGTENGLSILEIASGTVTRYAPDARNTFSLTNKSIRSIFIDSQHIGWLGTYEGGINKYDPNLTFFSLKRSDPYDPYGLSAPFVTSFAEAPNGDVFVGTDGGGLNLFKRNTNLLSHYQISSKSESLHSNLSILTLLSTKDQFLWIGTYQDGLYRFNPRTGTSQHFLQGVTANTLSNNEIFCLKEDRSGRIWIGTNGGGVNVYDPSTASFRRLGTETGAPKLPLLTNGYIRAFEEDDEGRIWIGASGGGLVCFNPRQNNYVHYDRQHHNLPTDAITSLCADKNHNLWVGTGGDGLIKMNYQNGKYEVFGESEGLANGVIRKIVEDQQGRIWVSTNKGVSWFDAQKKKFTNYTYFNGLQNNTFAQAAGLLTKDDVLFFGGVEGFNYISAKSLKANRYVPDILFTDLKVAGKSVTAADSSILQENISTAATIRLNFKQNFSISYVALNYTSPLQNKYAYRLKGFESEWNNVGDKNTAYYTNLSPGTYDFEVRASNNDGIWNQKGKSIRIIVQPPFWMAWYAYVLYVLAALSILFYIRYRGIQKLQREFKLQQERLETERSQKLDRLKIKFLTNLSHEFRTPISLILAPAEKLLGQSANQEHRSELNMIKRNSRRLLNLVNQLLDLRKLEEKELKLCLSEGEIISFMRDTFEAFRDLSEKKKITSTFETQLDQFRTQFDPEKVERILFNLLSNAFKFTPQGGSVRLKVYSTDDRADGLTTLIIEVADTGVGISVENQERIFERFYQTESDPSVMNQGNGIGLSIVKEFAQMHGGEITVESTPGKGSIFRVALPFMPLQALPSDEATDAQTMADELLESPSENIPLAMAGPINGIESEHLPLVLIIEDNDELRLYLRENLKKHYRIIEAVNGKEGWQKALSGHPELVVSDVMMPYMDGIELSLKLKTDKRTSHIPVILLTASTGEEAQLKGLSSGANDYLTKPFNFEILNTKIKNQLAYNTMLKKTFNRQVKVTPTEIKVQSVNEKLIKSVVDYIEANLTNTQLSVVDISTHVGISRGSLYNKILEITGQSPVEFIRSLKLEKAAVLLEKSDLNIAQIAYLVGFATPNYFARTFKDKYQMLPSDYIALKRKPADVKLATTHKV